jgi:hypothetical protein
VIAAVFVSGALNIRESAGGKIYVDRNVRERERSFDFEACLSK